MSILEALLEVFEQDELRTWHALAILVSLVEAQAESYGAEDWDKEYRYVFDKLYGALHQEYHV